MRVGLTGIGTGILACAAAASLAAADPVFPPGLRIGLEPPPGLVLSKHFPGFEDADHKVAVTILDLPGRAYEEIEKSMFGKSPPDLTVDQREMFVFNGGIGYLAVGHGTVGGVALHKWLLLANVENDAVGRIATLVNVEVPDAALAIYTDQVIRAALRSVTFRPAPLAERLKLLPFKIDALNGFRLMQATPTGVILTDGAGDDLSKQAYIIVSAGRGAPEDADARARFARDLLLRSPVRDLDVVSAEQMRITGWPGNEIKAQAKAMDGAPIKLVQWLRFGTGGFLRIVGIARNEDWDKTFTRFRAVRDGIDFR